MAVLWVVDPFSLCICRRETLKSYATERGFIFYFSIELSRLFQLGTMADAQVWLVLRWQTNKIGENKRIVYYITHQKHSNIIFIKICHRCGAVVGRFNISFEHYLTSRPRFVTDLDKAR